MEKTVLFAEKQKAISPDFNDMGVFARESLDHAVKDGIGARSGYTGFNAVKTGQTIVTVGDGRLWKDGGAYFSNQPGGVALNFLTALPVTMRRYAAIVAVAQPAIATLTEQREFLIDAATRGIEGRAVATESWRTAPLSFVAGPPAAQPEKFAVEPQYTILAWALLDTASVVSVEMEEATRWRSAQDAYDKADLALRSVELIDGRTRTTDAELARLAALLNQRADAEFMYRLAGNVAQINDKLSIPESFIDYGGDDFLDEEESDKTEAGYAAKIADGLRFPDAASATIALDLLNPLDPKIDRFVDGAETIILPASAEFRSRIVISGGGGSNEVSINQGNFDSATIVRASITLQRDRYGDEFTLTGSDAFWATGRYIDVARGFFQTASGEVFQVFPNTGRTNPDGVTLYRARRRWTEYTNSGYWTRTDKAVTEANNGHKLGQSFRNGVDRWVTALGVHGTRFDSSGPIRITIYETLENGAPNEKMAIATVTVNPATLTGGIFNRVAIRPTFLEQGKTYFLEFSSAGNHWLAIGDAVAANQAGGSLWYRAASGWLPDPAKAIAFDLFEREFLSPITYVQFDNLGLVGGIGALDILTKGITPAAGSLTWEVQIGGVWKALTEENATASVLASLPSTLPLRAVLQGSGRAQPGLVLGGCKATVSRPATAMKHLSITRTLPVATAKWRKTYRLTNWDAVKHTATLRLKVAGAEVAPSTVTDRIIDAKTIERTGFWTLASASATAKCVIIGASTDAADNFAVARASYLGVP